MIDNVTSSHQLHPPPTTWQVEWDVHGLLCVLKILARWINKEVNCKASDIMVSGTVNQAQLLDVISKAKLL